MPYLGGHVLQNYKGALCKALDIPILNMLFVVLHLEKFFKSLEDVCFKKLFERIKVVLTKPL
jgi:hypothetical protein